jgi:hypothetical protein
MTSSRYDGRKAGSQQSQGNETACHAWQMRNTRDLPGGVLPMVHGFRRKAAPFSIKIGESVGRLFGSFVTAGLLSPGNSSAGRSA